LKIFDFFETPGQTIALRAEDRIQESEDRGRMLDAGCAYLVKRISEKSKIRKQKAK